VRLLSQADDDEVPTVSAEASENVLTHEREGLDVLSPEALPTHAAMETDPFFSSQEEMRIEERADERRKRRESAASRTSTISAGPSIQWTTAGSAHSLHPRLNGTNAVAVMSTSVPSDGMPQRKGSSGIVTARRPSSVSTRSTARTRRHPTRTESGREFWGLPEAPKTELELSVQNEEQEEDSEESSDEEWVSAGHGF
jgi:hypothetical protein